MYRTMRMFYNAYIICMYLIIAEMFQFIWDTVYNLSLVKNCPGLYKIEYDSYLINTQKNLILC